MLLPQLTTFTENRTARVLDIVFCIGFMPLLVFLGPAHSWAGEWPLFFVTVCVWLYGCYFLMKSMDFPSLVIARGYFDMVCYAGVLLVGNYALTLYPLPRMDFVIPAMSEYQTHVRDYSVTLSLWLMFFAVVCYSLTTTFVRELYRQLLERKDIENRRDKAELALFKAQISPHFLFNTLNSLYSLVIGTSQRAEDAFIKFTELLKYSYVTIGNEEVPLDDEISYIQNYIDLQNIRLNRHTRVTWVHDVDDGSVMIPPMIFLTFVENAFKYGSSASRDCTISIGLTLREGVLKFHTHNAVMRHAEEFRTEMPVGLDNCRARLAGIFPGRHTLIARGDETTFNVNLEIILK